MLTEGLVQRFDLSVLFLSFTGSTPASGYWFTGRSTRTFITSLSISQNRLKVWGLKACFSVVQLVCLETFVITEHIQSSWGTWKVGLLVVSSLPKYLYGTWLKNFGICISSSCISYIFFWLALQKGFSWLIKMYSIKNWSKVDISQKKTEGKMRKNSREIYPGMGFKEKNSFVFCQKWPQVCQ